MSILQWNIRGIRAHREDLRYLLTNHNPKVVCLQETFLTNPPNPIPYYNFISSPHSINASSILVHHSVPHVIPNVNTTIPCTILRVFLQRWITIVSIYFSPSQPIDFPMFETLIAQLEPPLIVAGDFNCRHSLWGDSLTNTRGRNLVNFLKNTDLIILNSDIPTHFDYRTQTFSCIDLSLCSPTLRLDIHWSVLSNFTSSDHFPILLSPTNYVSIPNPPRWCFDKADWSTFTSLSTLSLPPSHFAQTSDMLTYFTISVLSAALTAIPRTTRSFSSKCVPWWNMDCNKACRQKRAAWSSYRCKRDTPGQLSSFIIFKKASACFRRMIRISKRNSWQKYVSTITSRTNMSAVWRKVHKLSGKHPPYQAPVLHINNEDIAETKRVADELGAYFSHISSGSHLSPQFATIKAARERNPIKFTLSSTESYNIPFTIIELQTALHSCRNTCEGPDGLHYQMIRHLPPISFVFLLTLFNRIWSSGDFPPIWREAIVLPFLKPNKTGTLPQDYRPIALTSCLCKLMERMINARLMWYIESKNLLSPLQFGYRKNRSTMDPLTHLDTYICTSFARHESTLAVFFDLEKAYDTTWRYHILQQLSSIGIIGNMGVFIHSFLQNRLFKIRIASTTSTKYTQHEGVPQGSVLSTTLFLIAINEIVSTLPSGVRSSLYVDDLIIYASGSSSKDLHNLLQLAISSISSWATNHGFRFSTSKSFSIFFSRSRKGPPPSLTLYGTPLQYRTTGTFLGLTFDSKLTWKTHILSLKEKAIRRLRLLKTLSHVSWGADRKTLITLHTTLILSILDYGCHIYSSASPTYLSYLDPVHTQGLRLALGAFRSSPVESLYVETGIPSLSYRRSRLSLNYFARLHQFSINKIIVPNSLLSAFTPPSRLPTPFYTQMQHLLSQSSLPTLNVLSITTYSFPPWLLPSSFVCPSVFNTTISKSNTNPLVLRNHFLEHIPAHNNSIHIYTDGSKSPTGSGFAILFPTHHYLYKLPTESNVLTTELYAILIALKKLLTLPQRSFTIFTDSRNSLHLIKSFNSLHPLVREIQNWLFRLNNRHKRIQLCWIPSHVGISGNEQVDSLARQATITQCPSFSQIPASDYYPCFKRYFLNCWQTFWTTIRNNKLSKVKPNITPWFNPNHCNRRWETALARLRIGHTNLTHSYLMSSSPPVLCPLCQVLLTVKHILISCPQFDVARSRAFPHLNNLADPCLTDVLTESSTFSIDNIAAFLQNINILHAI